MTERARARLAGWLLTACLGTAVLPAAQGASACRQVPSAALPLKFAGPELVPVFDGKFMQQAALYAFDLAALETRVTYAGVRRLKGSLNRSFFSSRDEPPGKAVFSRSIEFTLDPRSDDTLAWDVVSGNSLLKKADLEIALHDGYLRTLVTNNCPSEALSYWDPAAPHVPFSQVDGDGLPHFAVTIDGVALDAVLSTMQARSTITPKAAARAGLPTLGQARFGVLEIGTMQSRQGYLDIAEHAHGADLVLGNEFLRAYRVLLSKHQNKLYLSYQGGPSFPPAGAVTYWMEREADMGDGAIQFALWQRLAAGARSVGKTGAPAWLERAAAAKEVAAWLERARQARSQGRWQESQEQLRLAIKAKPNEPLLWLDMYLAARMGGDAPAAADVLRTARKDHEPSVWPHPVGAYFLGEIGLDEMLRLARRYPSLAHARGCTARRYAADFLSVSGKADEAARQEALYRTECAPLAAAVQPPL